MHFIVRLIVASILVLVGMRLFLKRKRALTLRLVITIISISFFITLLLGLVPFENLLFRFSSPQEVYDYAYQSPGEDLVSILQGDETAIFLIKDREGEQVLSSTITKDELGWKLSEGIMPDLKNTIYAMLLSGKASSFCIKNPYSNEFLLMITIVGVFEENLNYSSPFPNYINPYPNGLNIYDSRGSEFRLMPAFHEHDWGTYYAFVSDIDETYRIYVNDIEVSKELGLTLLL